MTTPRAAHAAPASVRGGLTSARAGGAGVRRRRRAGRAGGATSAIEATRSARGEWLDLTEDLFGPAETLHSTYRLLARRVDGGTTRAPGAGRATARHRPRHLARRGALSRAAQAGGADRPHTSGTGRAWRSAARHQRADRAAVTADQREISRFAARRVSARRERDVRRRAHVVAARDEPSLARFLPMRATACCYPPPTSTPTRVSAALQVCARVSDPAGAHAAPALRDAVHQVLERYHGQEEHEDLGRWPSSLPCSTRAGARRLRDSDEERQLRQKATAALTATTSVRRRTGPPCVVRAPVQLQARPHLVRGVSTGSTGCRPASTS